MVRAVGAGRVVFGSDYPLNLYPAAGPAPELGRLIGEAEGAGLGEDDLRAIFGGNIRNLLRLP